MSNDGLLCITCTHLLYMNPRVDHDLMSIFLAVSLRANGHSDADGLTEPHAPPSVPILLVRAAEFTSPGIMAS